MSVLKLANPSPANEPTSVRIEVRNAVRVVQTFSHADLAWRFKDDNESVLGPLTVQEVSTYEVRRTLYRGRKGLAAVNGRAS